MLKFVHRMGTKSLVAHMCDQQLNRIELYKEEFTDKENKWVSEDCRAKYDKMMEIRQKIVDEGGIVDESIICVEVLGETSSYIRGLGYRPKPMKKIKFVRSNASSEREELKLADCGPKVTNCGDACIATMPKLDLSWLINLSDYSLIAIAQNCQNLVEIRLVGCEQITGNGIRSFSGHRSLEDLVLDSFYNVYVDDIVHVVLGCLSLSHLRLHRALKCWMPSSTQEQLSKLSSGC